MNNPTLSIVILNWNNEKLVKQCLESLQKYPPTESYEIIVVDNGSDDNSVEVIQKNFPDVTLIANPTNDGYARGNNIGIKKTMGKYTLLLNEDIEFTSSIIDILIEYLNKHEDVGAVAPQLRYPDNTIQHTVRTFPTLGRLYKQIAVDLKLHKPDKKWSEYKMNWWNHDDTREIDQPFTSVLLVRTDILKELKGFDEKFTNYFNDVDLCYRMKNELKKKIIFIGDKGFVYHHHGKGMKGLKWKRVGFWNSGIRRFYRKHYVKSVFSPTYILLNIGLAVRTTALTIQYGILRRTGKY